MEIAEHVPAAALLDDAPALQQARVLSTVWYGSVRACNVARRLPRLEIRIHLFSVRVTVMNYRASAFGVACTSPRFSARQDMLKSFQFHDMIGAVSTRSLFCLICLLI